MDPLIKYECDILIYMISNGAFPDNPALNGKENIEAAIANLSKASNNEDFFKCPVFDNQRKVNEMMIEKLSGHNEANQAPPCPKCKSNRFYLDKQRKAADEAINNEIHCPGCGKIEYC